MILRSSSSAIFVAELVSGSDGSGTSPESEEEMPPALALGLRVTLQGLTDEKR